MALLTTTDLTTNTAADGETFDRYGVGVAVSGNGLVLAVGAWAWDDGSPVESGGVYIYDWNSGTSAWDARGSVLEADTPIADHAYGWSVALNNDGSVLAVGTPAYDTGGEADVGGVYIYDYVTSWTERSTIIRPAELEDAQWYGGAVALSSSGDILAVGSKDMKQSGLQRGAVYTYDWGGSSWTARTILTEPSPTNYDHFGSGVTLTDDALILVVGREGSSGTSTDAGFNTFDWSGSAWVHRLETTESVTTNLGEDVSISYDGLHLYVTEVGHGSSERVRYYRYDGSTWVNKGWVEPSDSPAGFGESASIFPNSPHLVVVGAPFTTTSTGKVYTIEVEPFANGLGTLISGSGTGTSPFWTANGSGSLLLSGSGAARIRVGVTAHLDHEYDLSAGYLKNTSHLDHEYELDAYLKKQAHLDQEYSIDVYKQVTAQLDQQYSLDAFVKKYSFLDQEYSISIFNKVIAYLDAAYVLDAFSHITSHLDQEYELNVFKKVQAHLDQEYSIDIFKQVTAHLDQEYSLFSFVKKTAHLDQEYSLDAYKIVKAWLDQEYSLDHFVKYQASLDQEYSLDAYQKVVSHLDQEYNLDAYAAVIAFLDIAYELDANEVFYTFATNLDTGATTKYTGFNFNSVSGDIAANENGLYQLTGADDAGTVISSSIETGKFEPSKMIAGTSNLSRLTDSYLGVSSDGNLMLTVTTGSDVNTYTLTPTTTLDTVKKNLARKPKGRYWTIKVENVSGSTMELDSIELLPQILSRRV